VKKQSMKINFQKNMMNDEIEKESVLKKDKKRSKSNRPNLQNL
jgi:hypothetical protein